MELAEIIGVQGQEVVNFIREEQVTAGEKRSLQREEAEEQ